MPSRVPNCSRSLPICFPTCWMTMVLVFPVNLCLCFTAFIALKDIHIGLVLPTQTDFTGTYFISSSCNFRLKVLSSTDESLKQCCQSNACNSSFRSATSARVLSKVDVSSQRSRCAHGSSTAMCYDHYCPRLPSPICCVL